MQPTMRTVSHLLSLTIFVLFFKKGIVVVVLMKISSSFSKKFFPHFLDSSAAEEMGEEQFPIYKITVENIGYYQVGLEYQAVGTFFKNE